MLLPPPTIVTLSGTVLLVRHSVGARRAPPHSTAQLFIICTGEPIDWHAAPQHDVDG
jgi:hypothetical protein